MNASVTNPAAETSRFGFWGNLPLSRKLLLAFGALFFFALAITIFDLWELGRVEASYENALVTGIEIRNTASHVLSDLLEARRQEKNFLLRWKEEGYDTAYANYVLPYNDSLAEMREHIDFLSPWGAEAATVSTGDMTEEEYNTEIASLTQNVDTYEQSFLNLIDALGRRGGNESTGLELAMRNAVRSLEDQIAGKPGLEQVEITLLQMRRHEKDYVARGGQEYVDALHASAEELRTEINATEALATAQKTELRALLDEYLKNFDEIVVIDAEIADHNEKLIAAARAVEPIADKLTVLGEQLAADDIATARTASAQTNTISIVIAVVALGASIFLAVYLSRQITAPVTQLTDTATQIAAGNFEAHAEVSSGDEVGTLAQTFNTMTARLRAAFEDVRRRSLAVQTTAEVSRRLSTATNPRQLAVDVVEQVQSAFKYYHAHIYFVDEETGDLVMAGGTGEAGAVMLARGHRIPQGRGLVGRAANTNAPVLVPDVTREEGWLPNPLLPETRSEAAVPISSGKTVLGVLDVQQNVVNGLTGDDVELLQSLAGQVAISYLNARTFEESRAKAELETLVNTIGQKIQRAATMEETLQTAIRELGTALGAQRVKASIGRKDNNN